MKQLLTVRKPEDDISSSSIVFELYENQELAGQRQEFIELNYPELAVTCHEIEESHDAFRELEPRSKNIDYQDMDSITYLNQETKQ